MPSIAPSRPLIRYHGGKWRLAPWIIGHFPEHRIYVEPFGGGGSVLLRKPRAYAEIYNDLDEEIVNLFRVVRDHGAELREMLQLTPYARTEFMNAYLPGDRPIELARRCIVRAYMGFGTDGVHSTHKTGFRSNSNRSGTTPAQDWKNYPAKFSAIIDRLCGVVVECRDGVEIITKHDSAETLHYVDPPYVHSTRVRVDKARGYRHEMTDDDHRRLATTLHQVKGAVVLSGYHSPLYDELYVDWIRRERPVFADGARPRTEVLWIKPAN